MPVKVLPAEDADIPRIFEISSLAFARNEPVWDIFFPNHWTPEGRQQGAERMTRLKNSDPSANYLKAVDSDTGEIMGMAKWFVFSDKLPYSRQVDNGSGEYWDSEEDKKYADQIGKAFLVERLAALERNGGNIVSLDVLTVDPKFQRRGVGEALVKWGLERADELGFEATVESSVYGKGLYEKCGFVFEKNVDVKVPGVTDRPTGSFAWLVRPKQTA